MVQDVEWVPHPDVTLDHPVAEYRALLNAWVKGREQGSQVNLYTDAPDYIDWPVLEKPEYEFKDSRGFVHKIKGWPMESLWCVKARGEITTEWTRPALRTLKDGHHLLASGKLLDPAE